MAESSSEEFTVLGIVEQPKGPTEPLGCSTRDAERLVNLKNKIELATKLIIEIQYISRSASSHEHSVSEIGHAASQGLIDIDTEING